MKPIAEQITNTRFRFGRYVGLAFFVLFFLFSIVNLFANKINPHNRPDRPIEEMVIEIEHDGIQAACSDLIGKWFVLETSDSLEFKVGNRLTRKYGLFGIGGYSSTSYHCDNGEKVASYSRTYWVGDESYDCTDSLYLGKIDEYAMVTSWDYCSDSDGMVTRVMVRDKE